MADPEIIVNCWLLTDSRVIYGLAVRTYMMAGTDAEMLAFLNALAPTDYRFAYYFPLPERYSINFEGAEIRRLTFAAGVGPIYEDLSVFDEAFQQINEQLTPRRTKGIEADSDWKPLLDPDNLLHVKTFIVVEPDGTLAPQITNPAGRKPNPSQVSTVANLWSVADGASGTVYAVSGRAYSMQGTEAEKRRLLRQLAVSDYRLAPKHTLPTPRTLANENSELFAPAFAQMAADVPEIPIGTKGLKTHKEPFAPESLLTERYTLVENKDRQSVQSIGAKPWWKWW